MASPQIDYQLITLTAANRDQLLAAARDAIRHRQADAPAILARLHALNPALAAHFHAKQHALSDLKLRMLCSPGPAASAAAVPSFIVISYCWHSSDWALAPAAAARPVFPRWEISEPMVAAIMGQSGLTLRAAPDEGVWLDKLCIDQADDADKATGIGAMDVIYRSARRVLILLEDVQLDTDEDAAAREYAGFFADMIAEVRARGLDGDDKAAFVDAYFPAREAAVPPDERARRVAAALAFCNKLLAARWFSRAWCAHESRVVPHQKINNPLILCFGSDGRVLSFEFRAIHYLTLTLAKRLPDEPLPLQRSIDYFNTADPQTLWQRYHRMQRLMGRPGDMDQPPTQHMLSILPYKCLHTRDLVSIALNTAGLPLTYSGRIDGKANFLWVFATVAIAAGDIVPLLLTGQKLRIPDPVHGGTTVSWMLDPYSSPVDDIRPSTLTASITGVTRDYIELDLLVMTDRPLRASPASLEKAAALLAEHPVVVPTPADAHTKRLMGALDTVASKHKMNRPGGASAVFTQMLLAEAMDCGIDWILRFCDVLAADTSGPIVWTYGQLGMEHNDGYAAAAAALLAHLGVPEDDSRHKEYLPQAIRFYTCIMDDRMRFLTLMPRRIQTGPADWGITKAPSNRSWVAVPVALASQPMWEHRVWIVEPFDPNGEPERPEDHLPDVAQAAVPGCVVDDICPVLTSDQADRRLPRDDARGTWRLREVNRLYGCQPLVGSVGGHVKLLERQRVYGAEDYNWPAIGKAIREATDIASKANAASVPTTDVANGWSFAVLLRSFAAGFIHRIGAARQWIVVLWQMVR